MRSFPLALEQLIECFKLFPGIGEKNALRLALFAIEMPLDKVDYFAASLKEAKENLGRCEICGNLSENDVCHICSDSARNKDLIMVVVDYKDIFAFENAGKYEGVYHVLNGVISPSDNVSPDDINIASLLSRIEKATNPEIILALKSSIEGDMTTLYIKKILEKKSVLVSRLSYGLPMGADIDYLDDRTLEMAIQDRKKIS